MDSSIALVKKTNHLPMPIADNTSLLAMHDSIAAMIQNYLKDGVDYGFVPGSKKQSLFKAGAERLAIAFGARPQYKLIDSEIDHNMVNNYTDKYGKKTSIGLYRMTVECKIIRNADQYILGEAMGSCSSFESKYISRPRDSENTILKMAQKRAFVAASLHAYGLSDRFTQDVEDMKFGQNPYMPAPHDSRKYKPDHVIEAVIEKKEEEPMAHAACSNEEQATGKHIFRKATGKYIDFVESKLKLKYPDVSTEDYPAIFAWMEGKEISAETLDEAVQKATRKP